MAQEQTRRKFTKDQLDAFCESRTCPYCGTPNADDDVEQADRFWPDTLNTVAGCEACGKQWTVFWVPYAISP